MCIPIETLFIRKLICAERPQLAAILSGFRRCWVVLILVGVSPARFSDELLSLVAWPVDWFSEIHTHRQSSVAVRGYSCSRAHPK